MERTYNPLKGFTFIYKYQLLFIGIEHLKAFERLTADKLRKDIEWYTTVYMLTMDTQLRAKAAPHINPGRREIDWDAILSEDFGPGHYAYIYWAFGLWGGCNWGGWEDDRGKIIPKVDAISRSYSMDQKLKYIATVAQIHRWGLQDNFFH